MFDIMMHNHYGVTFGCTVRFGSDVFTHTVEWKDTYVQTRNAVESWVPTVFETLVAHFKQSAYPDRFTFSVNDLKRLLFYIECGDIKVTTQECDDMLFIEGPVAEFVSMAANWVLTDNEKNRTFLSRTGYEVFTFKRDSSLVNGIRTPRGIVRFG
jgi:hypothetical protein